MKLKAFNWINYLKPFFFKDLVDHFKLNVHQIHTVGFLNFLAGIYHEFGIGHKVDR